MPDIIIPDISCLIFLKKINEIDLLAKLNLNFRRIFKTYLNHLKTITLQG